MPAKKGRRRGRYLTGARLSYLILLSLSLAFVFVAGGPVPYTLFYICALTPLFSLLYAGILRLQTRVGQEMGSMSITKGQEAGYLFAVYNRGPLPAPLLTLDFVDSQGLVLSGKHADLSLFPWQRSQNEIRLTFRYRGVYLLGVQSLRVTDIFSLVRLRFSLDSKIRVVVHPRVIELDSFALSQYSELQGGRYFRRSGSEALKDTRKYAYGDPMSRVHWNLTAQKNDLMTKLYEDESDFRTVFVLDLSPLEAHSRIACEDFMIEFCVAVLRFLLSRNHGVKLVFACADKVRIMEGEDMRDFDALLSVLAEVEFSSTVRIADLLRAAGSSCYSILLTAGRPDGDVLELLAGSERADCYHLLTGEGESRERYENSGAIRIYELLPEDDIRGVLEVPA